MSETMPVEHHHEIRAFVNDPYPLAHHQMGVASEQSINSDQMPASE